VHLAYIFKREFLERMGPVPVLQSLLIAHTLIICVEIVRVGSHNGTNLCAGFLKRALL